MMKVHYEHPPRKWDFYWKLGANLLFINLPTLLLALLWQPILGLPLNIGVAVIFTLNWWVWIRRRAVEIFLVFYDHLITKPKDCSHLYLPITASVENALKTVRAFDFERLGELQTHAGLSDMAITICLMTNPSRDICFEVFELDGLAKDTKIMGQFSSWFAGNRRVETAYPFGHTINTDDYLSAGVSTSLEAAYQYHLREVARFEAIYGNPVKISSVAEFLAFEAINAHTHDVQRMRYVHRRSLFIFAMLNLVLSSITYLVIGTIYVQGKFIPMQQLISLSLLVAATTAMPLISNFKGRDISQAKKKAS